MGRFKRYFDYSKFEGFHIWRYYGTSRRNIDKREMCKIMLYRDFNKKGKRISYKKYKWCEGSNPHIDISYINKVETAIVVCDRAVAI